MRFRFFASPRGRTVAALFCLAPLLSAQDLTLTPLEWVYEEDAKDQLPALRGVETPDVPAEIRSLADPAYAQVQTVVDTKGKCRSRTIDSTSPWLESAARDSFFDARFKPAQHGSKNINAQVQSFLIFNPKSASVGTPDATPRLLHVVPPTHPHATAKNPEQGTILVEAEIAASGEVTSTRAVDENLDASFRSAAANVVRRWTFAPARSAGQPVAATIRVPVLFTRTSTFALDTINTPPKVRKQAGPEYPMALRLSGLAGEVLVGFIVSVDGRVREAHIIRSNNPYFDQAALDSVLSWTFEPGLKDGTPVNCRMQVPIVFRLDHVPERGLYYVNRDRKLLAKLPPALQWDHPPIFKSTAFAAYPFEQLQAGIEGDVKANFIVGPQGRIIKVSIVSSAHPALGRAVEAMLDTFEFTPASKDGKPSFAAISISVRFDKSGTVDVPVESETRWFLRTLTEKPEHFAKLTELDATPRPISRRPPVFPSSLHNEVTEGSAMIEYVIDRKGAVHAPRIVKSSREEFGYAATQAVRTWKFAPPKKNGKAVDVLVRQPFSFNQKPPSASDE